MSKGNRIIPVRFTPEEAAAVDAELRRYNDNPCNEEISMSDFVRRAVREKIEHLTRSRSRKRQSGRQREAVSPFDAELARLMPDTEESPT